MGEKKNKRILSVEFLRIVSMLMIITLHFFSYTNIDLNIKMFTPIYIAKTLIVSVCSVGVNCYILISGYFGLMSNFKLKKLVKLMTEVWFYSFTIYLLLFVTNKIKFNLKDFIFCCFPTLTRQYWFVTSFVGLYLISPFLKKIAKKFSQKEYVVFLSLLFILLVIYYNLFFFCDNLNFGGATGIVWFSYMYLTGMYINKYVKIDYNKKHIYNYIIAFIIVFCTRIPFWILYILTKNEIFVRGASIFDSVYNSIGVTISSIFIFLMFLNIKITEKRWSEKIILFFSSASFSVYLLHDNNYIRERLWQHISFINNSVINLIIVWLFTIFVIYFICSIIDYIRKILFGFIFENTNIEKRIDELEIKVRSRINKTFDNLLREGENL